MLMHLFYWLEVYIWFKQHKSVIKEKKKSLAI